MKKETYKIKSTFYTHVVGKLFNRIYLFINIKNTFQHIHSTNSNNKLYIHI